MDLTRVSFEDLSDIRYAIYLANATRFSCSFLVLEFTGTCGIGSASNDDAAFMRAIVTAALEAWTPPGLILDMRQLDYEWGDMMTAVLCDGDRMVAFSYTSTTVVVSDRCREGLTSLVVQEMGESPDEWLFDDLNSAIQGLELKMNQPDEIETRRLSKQRRRRRIP